MKLSIKLMYINVAIIATAIAFTTFLSLLQIRAESIREAGRLQESHIKTFWELLRAKGNNFKIVEGKLLAGDYVINGNYELPDKVKQIFGGSATIFMDDIRISTNVLDTAGKRAVGTRLQGPAYDAIFIRGQSYRGVVSILGVPYFAAYDPIIDSKGDVIGAIYVGVKMSDFFAAFDKLKINVILTSVVLIGIFTLLGIFLVSERKRTEEALRESEDRLKAIVYGSPVPQFVIGINHKVLYWNKALEECVACPAESMIGTDRHWRAFYGTERPCLADLVLKGDDAAIRQWYEGSCRKSKLLEGAYEETGFFPNLGNNGKWLFFTATALKNSRGEVVGAVETIEDITESKHAEETVQEQLHFLQEMLDSMPNPIFYKDTDGAYLGCNKAFEIFFGLTKEAILGKTVYDVNPSDLAATYHRKDLELLSTRGLQTYESSVEDIKGIRHEVIFNKAVFTRKDNTPGGIVGIFLDITERKRMEDALRESEERFRRIFDESPIGASVVSLDFRFLRVNTEFCRITGYTEQELLACGFPDITFPEDLDTDIEMKKALIAGEIDHYQRDKRYVRKDGRITWVHLSVCLMRDAAGQPQYFLPMVEDITERMKLDEDLQKNQKLESLGVLAGGIAHDFNNLLTGILGNISLVKMLVNSEDKVLRKLAEAEKAAERAKDLTQQLLTFSRGGTPVKKVVSLDKVVVDSATFAARGSRARCDFSIPEDIKAVEADEGQISQVVNNLIINAGQAMPEGGVIRIVLENIVHTSDDCLPLLQGTYVRLSVSDEGTGIAEKDLQKIFDPYFTTKQKGSGLGLATVYSIIRNHGGYIDVQSQLGVGTTFNIYLPASEKTVENRVSKDNAPVMGKGRVLVMDDEELIREVVSEILLNLGYTVEVCGDGAEAVEIYKNAMDSEDAFGAVIMDLTVPGGMGGREAIAQLLNIDREVRGIVSSGYNNDPILASYREYGFSGVATKPYNMRELSEVLNTVMQPRK
jgi:PAS domain S-box-containing protein